jgi:serine/threonine protein kinase/tetratricopeptide (TPR) repeat protein
MDRELLWRKVEELLDAVMEQPPEKRAEYIAKACPHDPDLHREVESLLNQQADSFLESSPARSILTRGRRIGNFEILERIGKGGMGEVYRARDIRLQRTVAIKILSGHHHGSPQGRERFEREAKAISSLNHPGICTLHDIGYEDGIDFLVMEYLEGETLRQRIARTTLELGELIDIAFQIANALEAAHSKNIVHRDIKPANIFLSASGHTKIMDFGLAKLVTSHPSQSSGSGESDWATLPLTEDVLTAPGMAIGTVAYMSPEQARGEDLDARTDLFSLGVVLYEMATGQRPFIGKTTPLVFQAILNEAPIPPSRLRLDLPAGLERIINKALQKNRDQRYQRASDMGSDLKTLHRESDHLSITSPLTALKPHPDRDTEWPNVAPDALKRVRAIAPSSGIDSELRFRTWAATVGTWALVISLALSGWLFYSRKAQTLSNTDTIVLADFTNSTGDAIFDDTLKQALATELQQSPFLSILSDRKVSETLRLMGRSGEDRVDAKTALDLCQRAGSKAVLAGSIATLGSEYVIGLNAINCLSGDSLAREDARAAKKENILDALEKAATKLRERLGESLSTVQKFDTPLQQATTPSLDALRAYSLGRRTLIEKGDAASSGRSFQQAIRLDPNFAMAYLSLGLSYLNVGENSAGARNVRKAYELRDRVSEWEKYAIESRYYNSVVGDLIEARQIYALWSQTYPRDAIPVGVLSEIDMKLGQYDRAVQELRESIRLDPGNAGNYDNLTLAYLALNRLKEARATAQWAKDKNLDFSNLHASLYLIDFLEGDAGGMAKELAWFEGKSGLEEVMLAVQADTAAYWGRLEKAREFSQQAVASAERVREKETAAGYEAEAALREALFGYIRKARQHAEAALALSARRPDVEFAATLAFAIAGDTIHAEEYTKDLKSRFPTDTIVQSNYLPAIQAQVSVSRNEPSSGLEVIRSTVPYEFGSAGAGGLSVSGYPVYVRGKAYLAAHQPGLAAVEFEKILNHRGVVMHEPIGALAHLGLGQAYRLQGDTAKARSAYQSFFTLWKEADPDIPVLRQAKEEYKSLE